MDTNELPDQHDAADALAVSALDQLLDRLDALADVDYQLAYARAEEAANALAGWRDVAWHDLQGGTGHLLQED